MQNELLEHSLGFNRRRFLSRLSVGLEASPCFFTDPDLFRPEAEAEELLAGVPHFAPQGKTRDYLFQTGAPSQLESFD
jgi:hypothetical protein